jgi:hypothetical protein
MKIFSSSKSSDDDVLLSAQISQTLKVTMLENEDSHDSLYGALKDSFHYQTYEMDSQYDNFRTTHDYYDGVMTSLDIWRVNKELTMETKLVTTSIHQCVAHSNLIVIAFPTNNQTDSLFNVIKHCMDQMLLVEPCALVLLVEFTNNMALRSDKKKPNAREKEIEQMNNPSIHYTSVNLCNTEHLKELFNLMTNLASTGTQMNSKQFKQNSKYVETEVVPNWIKVFSQQCANQELIILNHTLETLEHKCKLNVKKLKKQASKLQAQ